MRLIHTADWHLGRRLKGVDRTPEIEYQLEELFLAAKILDIDAILVAGDIFDSPSPPAEAEKVAYRFFCQLREANIPAVIIAGNHDSAFRIEGLSQLLSHIGISARGRPKRAEQGGLIELETAHGRLCVAAMPFISERRLLKTVDLWTKDELEQHHSYQDYLASLFKNLTHHFREDSVNIIMAHLTVAEAKRAYSEVDYYTQSIYRLPLDTLPPQAQYIALGHIHKPQQIPYMVPTAYSGGLIQIDFGEAGEEKGFNLITVEPGYPAQVEFKPLSCQKPLTVVKCDESEIEDTLEAYEDEAGFLKVIVELQAPIVGLAEKVRKICPQTLMIETQYKTLEADAPSPQEIEPFNPVDAFRSYWQERLGTTLNHSVITAFEELYQELAESETEKS
jgi:DNA repair protein SbcD/Mre11